jgi:hypothetical protein
LDLTGILGNFYSLLKSGKYVDKISFSYEEKNLKKFKKSNLIFHCEKVRVDNSKNIAKILDLSGVENMLKFQN